ncbi:glycosyltransferase (plasmid) [Ensifer adhaerens]|uniref:glycosyltransferase n=1 Tax=Ensifer adhaerens TaxID=106592 RepID=UPI0023A926E0|nr:glycosyltransferase [Ensifer adhaerens]WDZ80924.1 glycosyltransferase [Ensifer adhaerens]
MKRQRPSIAVVIPLYNHADYILAALQSVSDQTLCPDEIIVIDDGSKDNGYKIARDFLKNAPGATVLKQKNQGAHNTINRAIGMAKTDYIAVLNSDDIFKPQKLQRCIEMFMSRPDIGLIVGEVAIMDSEGVEVTSGITIDWLDRAKQFLTQSGNLPMSLLHENFAATTSNFVFSKELWERNGHFQPLRYCHDLDFLMASSRNSDIYFDKGFEHIVYRVHPTNTIKENINKVRIEIAGVVTQALDRLSLRLPEEYFNSASYSDLQVLLATKNLTSLIASFVPVRGDFSHRHDFYERITSAEYFASFEQVLNNQIPTPLPAITTKVGLTEPLVAAIELSGFDKGGLEKVVLDCALEFQKFGITPLIFSVNKVGHLGEVARRHGVRVVQLPEQDRDKFYKDILVRENVKISMSHFSSAGYKVFRELGIPNITFIHNVYAMLSGEALANFLANDIFVDLYISVSQKATDYAVGKLDISAAKIITVPNGLIIEEHDANFRKSSPVPRESLGLKPEDYVFLNVASYNLHKAHYLMADAMKLILKKRDDIKIVCIGNEIYPPHVAQLRHDLSDWQLDKHILMPGYFSDIGPFHKMSDAFLLPSLIEGWSIAMNEAMYYGKPMILTNTGGAPEVIENNDIGIIIPNEYGDTLNLDSPLLDRIGYEQRQFSTAPYLANAMVQFASNKEYWAASGRDGYVKIKEKFDFTQTIGKYISIIEGIIR